MRRQLGRPGHDNEPLDSEKRAIAQADDVLIAASSGIASIPVSLIAGETMDSGAPNGRFREVGPFELSSRSPDGRPTSQGWVLEHHRKDG